MHETWRFRGVVRDIVGKRILLLSKIEKCKKNLTDWERRWVGGQNLADWEEGMVSGGQNLADWGEEMSRWTKLSCLGRGDGVRRTELGRLGRGDG